MGVPIQSRENPQRFGSGVFYSIIQWAPSSRQLISLGPKECWVMAKAWPLPLHFVHDGGQSLQLTLGRSRGLALHYCGHPLAAFGANSGTVRGGLLVQFYLGLKGGHATRSASVAQRVYSQLFTSSIYGHPFCFVSSLWLPSCMHPPSLPSLIINSLASYWDKTLNTL